MNTNYNKHGYEKLYVYQKSFDLVLLIYKLTKKYPKEENFVMVPQLRRAVLSVLANIVEGYSKSSKKEFVRYLDISRGSLNEVELFIKVSYKLNYFARMEMEEIVSLIVEVKKLIYSFQKSLRRKM